MKKALKTFLFISMSFVLVLFTSFTISKTSQAKTKKISMAVYKGKKTAVPVKKASLYQWKSTDKKIATVNKKGKVTGKKPGSVKVIGKYKKNKVVCTVKVGNYITGLKLNSASVVTLKINAKSQISAEVVGKNALYKTFCYSSSDEKIVTVSSKGELTGVSRGITQISVETKAVNKKNVHYNVLVNVCVLDEDDVVPVPVSAPAPEAITAEGVTLQKAVSQITKPVTSQAVVASFVVNDNGSQKTIYFLDREYVGTFHIDALGYTIGMNNFGFSEDKQVKIDDMTKKVNDMSDLSMYISNEGKRVMVLADRSGDCALMRLDNKETVNFHVYQKDNYYGTDYALIVAEGNTLDKITVR